MADAKTREFIKDVEELKRNLNELNRPYDFSQVENQLKELKNLYNKIEGLIQEIEEEDDMEKNNRRPLLNKFNEYKEDFENLKKQYNQKIDEISTIVDQILLMRGELHGEAKETAQRNMALQNIKMLDEEGKLIEGIAKNVEESIHNIRNMKVELHNQDERLLMVDNKVEEMDKKVDDTKKIFDQIDKRTFCRKLLL